MAAVGAALVAILVLALLTPRFGEAESVNWLLTLLGGVIAGGATYLFLGSRKAEDAPTENPPR